MPLISGTAPCKLQFLRLLVTRKMIIYNTNFNLVLSIMVTEC
jgi:hypothetical protein